MFSPAKDWADIVFAFHEGEELGPRMLVRIAKHTGLRPEDLYYSDQIHKPPNYTLHLTAGASGPARTLGPRPPAAGERGRQADRDAEGAAE